MEQLDGESVFLLSLMWRLTSAFFSMLRESLAEAILLEVPTSQRLFISRLASNCKEHKDLVVLPAALKGCHASSSVRPGMSSAPL